MTEDRVGERIRAWRRRRGGMTQKVLAGLSGLSQGYISQIESGQVPLDRKSAQTAIAAALDISVTQLVGRPDYPDPVLDRALAYVPAIRSVLIEMSSGEQRHPGRDQERLRVAGREVSELRNAANYAKVAPLLPALLLDVFGHGSDMAPEMVAALFDTLVTLKAMGLPDLARDAAEIGLRVARDRGEPVWVGAATYSWIQAFPPESAALGLRLAARAADELQHEPGRGAQEVYGRLHLLAAITAAVATRPDDTSRHLDEATAVAAHLGEPERNGPLSAGFTGSWFGPANVDFWRVSAAAELGDPGTAVQVAARIDLAAVPVPNRHVYYYTDLGRSLAAGGEDREAMHALARAERVAPQHVRFNPVVRDLVASLIQRARRRAVGDEMLSLAHRLGIDVL